MLKKTLKRLFGNSARSLFPSPSKMFMLRAMKKFLMQYKDLPVGLDIAAADFKYRYLFKVDTYVGIDLNISEIKKGKQRYPEDNTIGIATDFFNISKLPQFADIVVSTHTLAHFSGNKQTEAVELLVQATRPGGGLLFNIPIDHDKKIESILRDNFLHVRRINYGLPVFMKIENYFSKRTTTERTATFLLLLIGISVCWLLSYLENIFTTKTPYYTLYSCKYRKIGGPSFPEDFAERLI